MTWLKFMTLAAVLTTGAAAREGVVLLHGLCRTKASMAKMQAALTTAGYVVSNDGYRSRSAGIESLSEAAVAAAMRHPRLAACTRIHFVAHSLGGLLVRSYFARHPDPRLGRVVMLGPPNQGSEVVDRLGSWWAFRKLNGPAGSELGTAKEAMPNRLGPVAFEVGVIAGDRSLNWINSLMIDGRDDGKVAVARTRVAGMKDHLVVHATHPFLMKNDQVIANTITFLKTGSFQPQLGH
jgi:triacylglycerol lipase